MAKRIRIKAGRIEMSAELNESKTASLIWDALPLKAKVNTWGEEIYFSIPVKAELDDPKEVVEKGDLGYWPQGPAFCIFFGPTPISKGEEIRPASGVNLVGRLLGDSQGFKKVSPGERIILEKEEE
ncbi:hypothetical protein L6386_07215 [bacterium]|nr:hypothetical protein [bacterium]MBU4310044.1 hypothetical protein [bacterium]MBU4561113.1 hypothetical protein [bacterium]MCG2676437.1 hypothetical protein [bacterium]MCG2678314.1 hypothetical protein [bacterium]